MLFDERFRPGLAAFIRQDEYDAIIKKINTDLNMELLETTQEFRKWARIWIFTAYLGVGLIFTPILVRRSKRQQEMLELFWQRIRAYLAECNRRIFTKRRLEWKLIEQVSTLKGRDIINPLYAYRLDIIQKMGRMQKAKSKYNPVPTTGKPTTTSDDSRLVDVGGSSDGTFFFGSTNEDTSTLEGASMHRPSKFNSRRVSFTSKVIAEGDEIKEEDEFLLEPPSGDSKESKTAKEIDPNDGFELNIKDDGISTADIAAAAAAIAISNPMMQQQERPTTKEEQNFIEDTNPSQTAPESLPEAIVGEGMILSLNSNADTDEPVSRISSSADDTSNTVQAERTALAAKGVLAILDETDDGAGESDGSLIIGGPGG